MAIYHQNAMEVTIDFINDQRSNYRCCLGPIDFWRLQPDVEYLEHCMLSLLSVTLTWPFEASNLARTQILTQSGTAMLAQASQISQNILSLLK